MQQASIRIAPRRPALAAGLLVSVLLHALVLFYVRLLAAPSLQADTRPWTQPLTVRLLPPPPPPTAAPARPTNDAVSPTRERTVRPRRAPPPSITAAPQRATPVPAAPEAGPAQVQAPAPRVDIEAARAAARGIARELPSSDNWAAEKLARARGLEETQDEKLGKSIARSARPDCRNGEGGLLAPLFWMMDKKDSGCKF